MASPFPGQFNTFQVGSFFVNTYYQTLQSHPDSAHQFYRNVSTMVRLDSITMESATATGTMQINDVVKCLNLNGIEIKTAHFLDSWNGGILVMVSGLLQLKDYSARRRFVQTFFLAPQENGYFVLNDIFQFLGDEHDHRHQAANYIHNDYETKMSAPNAMTETVPSYMAGEVETKELMASVHTEECDDVDKYEIHEVQQQASLEFETGIDETPLEETVHLLSSSTNIQQDAPPAPVHTPPPVLEEECVGELPKQTYASVLRTKGQSGHPVPHSTSLNKVTMGTPELHQVAQSTQQQFEPVPVPENSKLDTFQEVSMLEDEEEFLSVYVGNLAPSTSVFDLEKEFQAFGRIRPDGVAIRSRKEAGVFYGFVEFEDISGVQNALKASPIELNGRLIHVEERRPNSGFSRGGRRGRGRGGYPSDVSRGRFGGGRSFGRGGVQDHDRDYNSRLRGNGYQRRGGRSGSYSSEMYA